MYEINLIIKIQHFKLQIQNYVLKVYKKNVDRISIKYSNLEIPFICSFRLHGELCFVQYVSSFRTIRYEIFKIT